MELSILNGPTPQSQHEITQTSSINFPGKGYCTQYLGMKIAPTDGNTNLSEGRQSQTESKSVFTRVISHPHCQTQQPGSSKADTLQGVENSDPKDVLASINIEAIGRFQLLKESLALSDTISLKNDFAQPMTRVMQKVKNRKFSDNLKWMRELIQSKVDDKLATVFITEVDKAEESNSEKIAPDNGTFIITLDYFKFLQWANNLLTLVAACSDIAEQDDSNTSDRTFYLSTVFQTYDHKDYPEIARKMAFLSTHPDSEGYSRYIEAVSQILKDPAFTVEESEVFKQYSNVIKFSLLEGNKTLTSYLTLLKNVVEKLTPEYSAILLSEIEAIATRPENKSRQSDDSPPSKKTIQERVHRLLLLIATFTNSHNTIKPSNLAPYVQAIMMHGSKKNIPYLVSGLACLVQSPSETHNLLCRPDSKGGNHLLLAPLALVRLLHNANLISKTELEKIFENLTAHNNGRRAMKDGKAFHQWLVTLDKIQADKILNKPDLGQTLQNLTLNMPKINDNLSMFETAIMMAKDGSEALKLMGLDESRTNNPLALIVEKGAASFSEHNLSIQRWLTKQRYYTLLYVYLRKIKTEFPLFQEFRAELIKLTNLFLESSASNKTESNKFVESRQSPASNPHLQAVYEQRPEFQRGWGANFKKGFSSAITNRMKSGEILKLSEDPWDLFISGYEVPSCLAPNGGEESLALMSYVMDGRNAMIVKKNSSKGNILSRTVIRIVLDSNNNPVLFIEPTYLTNSEHKNIKTERQLYMDAAQDIAGKMKLSLYHRIDGSEDQTEHLKLLKGRAPFENLDSAGGFQPGKEVVIKAVKAKPRVTEPGGH